MSFPVLPNEAIAHCFKFVGRPGNYRFISGVCRRFEAVYDNEELYDGTAHRNRTYWSEAASSVSRAQLCLEENYMGRQQVLSLIAFEASRQGRLEVLSWAQGRGLDLTTASRFDDTLMDIAAAFGQIHTLEYLRGVGCDWTEHTCISAVVNGQFNTLRFLHEHGCHGFDQNPQLLVMDAARQGQLEILTYLFEDLGYDFDQLAISCSHEAAGEGHVHVLQYLHERGHTFDGQACVCACMEGQLEALQYLFKHGSTWNNRERERAIQHAGWNGHVDVVQWVRDQL